MIFLVDFLQARCFICFLDEKNVVYLKALKEKNRLHCLLADIDQRLPIAMVSRRP